MKVAALVSCLVFVLAQSALGHYIFKVLVAGDTTSGKAVRQPPTVEPFHDITSAAATCNVNTAPATEAPSPSTFGKAPSKVADWDGSGQAWFKIAEWGVASYNPVKFKSYQLSEFDTTVPENTPPGEYLARIEQIALHLGTGVPEIFVSCAQIKVTGSGTGNPAKVSIPGYIKANDPGVIANIYNGMTNYTVPGPKVWRG
ncbi:hypothetical protein FA13DRAFT_1803747 [Coprinellus micaceus]|uniref:AA9 family lytic polysaccharide monooxygenase n=1 Tax=Coprinellus micaceus TaxID=71717 RepID=A0A4Y7S9Y4_COPMI|nr:hypothetical protein FA13DRAFT_1803747 [Coprinellus micaceus]